MMMIMMMMMMMMMVMIMMMMMINLSNIMSMIISLNFPTDLRVRRACDA